MKILSLGSDRNLFQPGSAVRERMLGYANLVDAMHVIVFSKRSLGFVSVQISPKLWVHSTNSGSKLSYVFDAIKLAKRIGFSANLVTCQDPFESGLAGWLIARKLKAKLHLQIHTDLFNPYFKQESLLNRLRVLMANFLLPRADQIRVVSQRIANSLQSVSRRIKANIEVRPIFVDVEKIKNAPIKTDLHKKYPQFDKIILMTSRLTKEKNIGLGIKAMPEILKSQPKTGLIIVGSGPEEKRLKLLASSFQLLDSVIFEDWSDDLPSYYKTADLFLNTSWYEGYGMTLVEAQAAGCKVVSTDVGVAKEIGLVIIPHEYEKFTAQNILKILT